VTAGHEALRTRVLELLPGLDEDAHGWREGGMTGRLSVSCECPGFHHLSFWQDPMGLACAEVRAEAAAGTAT
jgi:hypothetical protein